MVILVQDYSEELAKIENDSLKKLLSNSINIEIQMIVDSFKDFHIDFHEGKETREYIMDRDRFINCIKSFSIYDYSPIVLFTKYSILKFVIYTNKHSNSKIKYDFLKHKFSWECLDTKDRAIIIENIKTLYETYQDELLLIKKTNIKNTQTIFQTNLNLFSKSFVYEYHNFYTNLKREITEYEGNVYRLDINLDIPIEHKHFFKCDPNYILDICSCIRDKMLEEGNYVKMNFDLETITFTKTI